jgi:uncharacterized protein YkwD
MNAASVDAATLCLIDWVRASYHLRPLRANPELQGVATSQALDMVRRDYFADARPTGQTPVGLIAATRYAAQTAKLTIGQNIAWGSGDAATPASIVAAWMRSPPHRKIILTGGFHDAGVGVSATLPSILGQGADGATYAIEFGARRRGAYRSRR